jgi:hypothetical protein
VGVSEHADEQKVQKDNKYRKIAQGRKVIL